MEKNVNSSQQQVKIPSAVWFLGAALAIGLVAIFAFKVAVGTVAYYGFLAFMVGGHFFMHGSHGSHGSSAGHQHSPTSTATEPGKSVADDRSGHSGGCH